MKSLIAVDPGAHGAFAIRDFRGRIFTERMPTELRDLSDLIRDLRAEAGVDILVWLENVGFHRPGNSAVASCTFGKHVGHLEMGFMAHDYPPVQRVTPLKWMIQFFSGKEQIPKDKKVRKLEIQQRVRILFPDVRDTALATSDALAMLDCMIKSEAGGP